MKNQIRKLINRMGYNIVPITPTGKNPISDMKMFLPNDEPLIFDIGANIGQTVNRFRSAFPKAKIYSFEPSPTTFETLKGNVLKHTNVYLHNCAMGSSLKQMTFFENTFSEMSSFLKLSEFGWGTVAKETLVDVNTVDHFCSDNGIDRIDILKSDTQGFDFEVFKGAEGSMRLNKIGLIYFEVTFSDMYKDLPSFGEIYNFLVGHNFRLVSFYKFFYQEQLVSWTDAVFVHKSLIPENAPGTGHKPVHGL